jgi:hypothetical protein
MSVTDPLFVKGAGDAAIGEEVSLSLTAAGSAFEEVDADASVGDDSLFIPEKVSWKILSNKRFVVFWALILWAFRRSMRVRLYKNLKSVNHQSSIFYTSV